MKSATEMENVIIVGGGPAGLGAAIYNARAFLKPLVVAGSPPGGQLMLTSDVENYPGFESILGPDLIEKMRKHAEHFETRFIDDNVKAVVRKADHIEVKLAGGQELKTKALLVATGASAIWLGLESEAKLRGRGVSACATCDGFFFKNKEVVVVGGGDTAMEEALTLTVFASKVYLVHRRDEFKASKIMQKRVFDNEKIEVVWNAKVTDVQGEDFVKGVDLEIETGGKGGGGGKAEKRHLPASGLFVAIGHKPSTDFLVDSGVQLDEKGYILTTEMYARQLLVDGKATGKAFSNDFNYATAVKGVFAAGDCVDHVYRQGITATGMGVAAALEVERYIVEMVD